MQYKLMRSRNERVIAGIAGGIGNYLIIDPVIVRLAFVMLVFSGGIGLLFYPILWLIMPREPVMPSDPAAFPSPYPQQQLGQQANAGNRTDTPYYVKTSNRASDVRFDPLTGAPLQYEEYTSIQDSTGGEQLDVNRQLQRNWIVGIILVTLGIYFVLQTTFLAPFIIPALFIIGGVVLLLRRKPDQ